MFQTAMYYVHTDHLGSLNVLTNESGAIEQELSFDAWGYRRDPATLQNYTTTPAGLITDRGFTAHEHMDAFKLINMNGWVYDPLLGKFLSADLVVTNGISTQDYNRFSYCVNNLLMFTNPSGYVKLADFLVSAYNSNFGGYWESDGGEGSDGFGFNFTSGSQALEAGIVYVNNTNSLEQTENKSAAGTSEAYVKIVVANLLGDYNSQNFSVGTYSNKNGLNYTATDNATGTPYGTFFTLHNQNAQGGNPIDNIATMVDASGGFYKEIPSNMNPIISKHYGNVDYKFGKTIGRIGTLANLYGTLVSASNLINKPSSVESWSDAFFTGVGWVPIIGSTSTLLYMCGKDQVQIRQENIMSNRNPMQGVYVPATGDLWIYDNW